MRHECPVSPLLFILQTEPLACAILTRRKIIRGISLPDINPETIDTLEVKINGYVDDAQFFVSTEESVVECFSILKRYEMHLEQTLIKTKLLVYTPVPGKIRYPNLTK